MNKNVYYSKLYASSAICNEEYIWNITCETFQIKTKMSAAIPHQIHGLELIYLSM